MATRQEATERTRLTRDDIGRMVDRVSAVLKDQGRDACRAWIGGPMTAEALERIACHSIGCTADDLRPAELVTVAQIVDAATEHAKTMLAARVWPA